MPNDSFDPKGHFTKVGEDDYVGPSGKHFTYAQVKLYYSAGGWDNVPRHAMNRQLHVLGATSQPYTKMYDGREHLVVPVVALIGNNVIHAVNAQSAEYVPTATLASSPQSWNGRPLMLGHPAKNGQQISANDANVLETQSFGQIFNSRIDGNKLLMDAYIDPVKAEKIGGAEMIERLKNNEMCEVSVGAFVQTLDKSGNHNGKSYKAEWATISPDHLAFLPNGRGACSIEMGCGTPRMAMLVTAEGNYKELDDEEYVKVLGGYGSGTDGGLPVLHKVAITLHNQAAMKHGIAANTRDIAKTSGALAVSQQALEATQRTGDAEATTIAEAAHAAASQADGNSTDHLAAKSLHEQAAEIHSSGLQEDTMDDETKALTEYLDRWRTLRNIPQSKRDKMDSSSFAGPHESFPIETQADVDAAKRLIGHADNPEAVKSKIKSIAKRKGLKIPDAWQAKAAEGFKEEVRVLSALPDKSQTDCPLCKGSGKIRMGKVTCPKCGGSGTMKSLGFKDRLKTAISSMMKVLDEPDDSSDATAELISYKAVSELIEQAEASLDSGKEQVDALVAGETSERGFDNDDVEDARLEALISMCIQLYGTVNGIMKIAVGNLSCNDGNQNNSGTSPMMAYAEHRAAIGARHNAEDTAAIQQVHDHSVSLGADCSGMKTAADGDCGCGGSMNKEERTAVIQALIAKKDIGLTKEDEKWLQAVPDERLAAMKSLSEAKLLALAKTPADEMIQNKANADAALAAHAHGLNAIDQAAAAKRLAKAKADAEGEKDDDDDEDGKDDDEDEDEDEDDKKDMKAAKARTLRVAAAKAAGKTLEEYEEDLYLQSAPQSIRDLVSSKRETDAQTRKVLVKQLKVAAAAAYTEKELEAMSLRDLNKLAMVAKVEKVDFSGRGVPQIRDAEEDKSDVYRNPPDPYKIALEKRKTVN